MVQNFAHFYTKTLQRLLFLAFFLFFLVIKAFPLSPVSASYLFKENSVKGKLPKVNTLSVSSASIRTELPALWRVKREMPVILIDDSGIVPFETNVGEENIQNYYIEGYYLTPGESVIISLPSGPFSISTSSTSGFGSSISLPIGADGSIVPRDIFVKYAPAEAGGHTASIDHSGGGASLQTVNVEGNATALPVEWLSFKARAVRGAIVLDWVTASEKYNSHFEVEISKDPVAGFEKVGRVNSKEGNSQSATHYRFEYYLGELVGTRYFRLKQLDIDQAFDYSRIVAVEMAEVNELLAKVAPNPINISSQLSMAVAEAGELRVLILTMSGATVYSKTFALEAGANKIQLGLTDKIGHGVYMLSTEFKGRFSRLKLIKE